MHERKCLPLPVNKVMPEYLFLAKNVKPSVSGVDQPGLRIVFEFLCTVKRREIHGILRNRDCNCVQLAKLFTFFNVKTLTYTIK